MVTEEDRAAAVAMDAGRGVLNIEAIAAALAAEREKARAETREWMIDQIENGATFGRFQDEP